MTCEMCVNYEFYKMVISVSGRPYGFSGTIPCFTCKRYCNLSDKFVLKEKGMEKEMKKIMENEIDDIYCELRGLLKEHAQFPDMWDTDKELRVWLKQRGQL